MWSYLSGSVSSGVSYVVNRVTGATQAPAAQPAPAPVAPTAPATTAPTTMVAAVTSAPEEDDVVHVGDAPIVGTEMKSIATAVAAPAAASTAAVDDSDYDHADEFNNMAECEHDAVEETMADAERAGAMRVIARRVTDEEMTEHHAVVAARAEEAVAVVHHASALSAAAAAATVATHAAIANQLVMNNANDYVHVENEMKDYERVEAPVAVAPVAARIPTVGQLRRIQRRFFDQAEWLMNDPRRDRTNEAATCVDRGSALLDIALADRALFTGKLAKVADKVEARVSQTKQHLFAKRYAALVNDAPAAAPTPRAARV